MNSEVEQFDVLVVGGGPAGATAALRARRRGLTVALVERDQHPRFHIGESFLPRQTTLLRELGLLEKVLRLPHVPKHGASFAMGHEETTTDFWFARGPRGEDAEAISIERSLFDQCLIETAAEEGVCVFERTAVQRIETLLAGRVVLQTSRGDLQGRMLIDASGQGTLVGTHLGTRRTLPDLRRVAYFQHFAHVDRRDGKIGGHPIIVMCEEGWFWMIPLDDTRTSIGLVMRHDAAKASGVAADRMLAWGIARCPFVRARVGRAAGPEKNLVCADFSYTCRPYAGPGYFMVGDAATFIDPIFSTGVCMGMMSAVKAADAAAAMLAPRHAARAPAATKSLRNEYRRYVESSSSVFFSLVRRFYRPGFRDMFLEGRGPVRIHSAILSLLAGHVFPRPVWSLRWRLALFAALLWIHDRSPLVPVRGRFSLLNSQPASTELKERPLEPVLAGTP